MYGNIYLQCHGVVVVVIGIVVVVVVVVGLEESDCGDGGAVVVQRVDEGVVTVDVEDVDQAVPGCTRQQTERRQK